MASNVHIVTAARNAIVDALVDLFDVGGAGSIRLYDGTQPANGSTAIGAQNLLATIAMGATAFGSASSGSAALSGVTLSVAIAASGTCTWGSFVNNAGVRQVDFSVGTSGADCNFDSVTFSSGASANITSFTVAVAA